MTMHIYFNKDKDGYKRGWSGYVERSLARRFCQNGIAVPYKDHLDKKYDHEQAIKKAKEKEKADKKKADEEKKKSLLDKKPKEKAESKKQKNSERAIKP